MAGFLFWINNNPEVSNPADLEGEPVIAQKNLQIPRRYWINVELDPTGRKVAGLCRLELKNDQDREFTELYFHLYPNAFAGSDRTPAPTAAYRAGFSLGRMDIQEVRVQGEKVQGEVLGTLLKVHLAQPLAMEKSTTVEVSFTVTIPQQAYRFGSYNGVTMLSNWYPVLAVRDQGNWHLDPYSSVGDPFYSQVSDYEVRVLLPAEQVVAASGVLEQEEAVTGGKKRLLFKAPKARDFALAASANYQSSTQQIGHVQVHSFYLPQHEASGKAALEAASKSLTYFQDLFCLYPYTQFSLAEVPMEGFSGMEYPGLVLLSDREYPGKGLRQWESLVAHEVAHQWWYGLVGNDQIQEAWIDEGLAVWSAERYLRQEYGDAGASSRRNQAIAKSSFSGILRPLPEFLDQAEYQNLVYHGGSLFWEELEKKLGREKVERTWRALIEQYAYKEVSTRQLVEIVNAIAGKDYTSFFEERLGIQAGYLAWQAANKANNAGQQPDWTDESRRGIGEKLGTSSGEFGAHSGVQGNLDPSLVISQLETIEREGQTHLIIQVKNNSTVEAGRFQVLVEDSQGLQWRQSLAGLAPGRTYTFSCSGAYRSGVVRLLTLENNGAVGGEKDQKPYQLW